MKTPAPRVTTRVRARELGLIIGPYATGRYNAITDVPGVLVGHSTIISGEGKLVPGHGPVRTGVTAILPNDGNIFSQRVIGGGFVLNGAGELSGMTQLLEWGLVETPIVLTNTLAVGTAARAVVRHMVERHPGIGGEHDVVIPLVGECDDSWLNDIVGGHVRDRHVFAALDNAASGPVAEGNVGGGTGMITCDFKGGIGTSSRKLPPRHGGFILGLLVMSNFGRRFDLRMNGIPVGEMLADHEAAIQNRRQNYGSIIAVLATNAPLLGNQLNRLAKRVALGIGRAGSFAAHGSGEIVMGFSTANSLTRGAQERTQTLTVLSDQFMDPLYRAAIDATEEAILNAICMAEPMEGINRRVAPALPLDKVRDIVTRYGIPAARLTRPPRKQVPRTARLADRAEASRPTDD